MEDKRYKKSHLQLYIHDSDKRRKIKLDSPLAIVLKEDLNEVEGSEAGGGGEGGLVEIKDGVNFNFFSLILFKWMSKL